MAKNEVAKTQGGELAFQNEAPAWAAKGNRGSEDVGAKDVTIPRIDILQALSPQIKKSDPTYIEGSEPGMLFNTVTGELYPEGVIFVPCVFKREYVIWRDRKKGGGFHGAFPSEIQAIEMIKTLENPQDCEAKETHQHFGMIIDPKSKTRTAVALSMSKSKLKASRKLNSLVQMTESDRFAKAYKIASFEDSSSKGEFYNFAIVQLGWVDEETYKAGEKLYKIVKAGEVDVVRDEQSASESDHVKDVTDF